MTDRFIVLQTVVVAIWTAISYYSIMQGSMELPPLVLIRVLAVGRRGEIASIRARTGRIASLVCQ